MRGRRRVLLALVTGAGLLLAGVPAAADPLDDPGASTVTDVADPAHPSDAGQPTDRADLLLVEAPAAPEVTDALEAPAEVVDGRVLVRFDEGATAESVRTTLADAGLPTEVEEVDGTGFVVVDVAQTSVEDAAAELEAAPGVAEVQPDVVRRAAAWTDDPVLEYAWPYVELMRLPRAWDATTGSGVVIAVLDTGVDPGVRDLAGALLPGIDLVNRDMNPADDHGHGTLMATTAAGRGNNGVASVGAAWTASVLPIKVLDASGSGADSVIAEGVAYAVDHGADVINLSLAGPGPSTVLRDAIASATARGVTVVAATGNAGREDPQYPAAYAPEIAGFLAVGATDDDGGLARFSSWGSGVSVVAPGWRIAGQVPGGATVVASGTSSATALVSGVAALLVSTGATTPADVENRLLASARDAGPRGVDPYFGRGVVDAAGALGLGHALPLDRAPGDPGASDDLPATARPLAAGTGTEATLSPEGDTDWYRVDVPAAGRYTVAVEQPGRPVTFDWPPDAPDLHVDVLDGNGRALVASGAGTSASLVGVVVDVTAAGPVLVGVSNLNGTATTQTYRVSVTAGASPALAGAATSVPDVWFGASTAPRHSAGAPLRPTWTLTAFRGLDAASVTASTVQLLEGETGAAVPVSRTYDAGSRRLSVVPSQDLLDGHHYTLVVAGVRDVDGSVQALSERLWSTVGAAGDRFTPVEPLRVLDTRDGVGLAGVPRRLGPGQHVDLQLSPGATGVPVGATAVVLNVTAASPEGPGNIRVFPAPAAGSAVPEVSNLNLTRGVDQPNLVTVTLGPVGVVRLFVDGTWTDVVADLAGYYSPGGATGYVPLEPVRVLDGRDGTGAREGRVGAGQWVDLQVTGRNGVPDDAAAVVLNVTGVSPGAPTDVRVYPTPADAQGQEPPLVSNLNLAPGRDQPNLVTVRVGDGGRVRLFSHVADPFLVADLAGYYAPTGAYGYVPLAPARIVDSRVGLGLGSPLAAGAVASVGVAGRGGVPASAVAAVLNVTAVAPTGPTNVRVFPRRAGSGVPLVSTLNVLAGRDEPNLAIARLGEGGQVSVYAESASLDLVADVSGYFVRAVP